MSDDRGALAKILASAVVATLTLCACLIPVAERHPGRHDGGGGDGSASCQPTCDGRACGDDGCGGSCGRPCPQGQGCNPTTFQCATCGEETDLALCQRLSAHCGELRARDLCGLDRVAPCGACGEGLECRLNACVPAGGQRETDQELCARTHVECGPLDARDDTGAERHVDECGPCEQGDTCVERTCVCDAPADAELCRDRGAECGPLSAVDRCGRARTVECGACGMGLDCRAGACVPREVAETNAQLCQNAGVQCGPLDATDRMGQSRHVDECGPCAPGTSCDFATGHCAPCTPESDAMFCAHEHLCGSSPPAPDNCGLTRTVASCPGCSSREELCSAGHCIATSAPAHDACSGAEPLALTWTADGSSGTARVASTTSGGRDDASGSCSLRGGRDVAFALTLSSDANVVVEVTPIDDAFRPAVYLRSSCAQASSELGCARGGSEPGRVHLGPTRLHHGTYTIWVDGAGPTEWGAFSLYVGVEPLPPVPNETCANPSRITLDSGLFDARSIGNWDDYLGSCGGTGGWETVYSLSTSSPSRVRLIAQDAVVYLRSSCASTDPRDELGCISSPGSYAMSRMTVDVPAGTYYVFLDWNGAGPSSSSYGTRVRAGPAPANDTCATATSLSFGAGGQAVTTFDTRLAYPDYAPRCAAVSNGLRPPDVVFKVTVPPGKKISAAATPDRTASQDPVVSLRYPSCESGPEVACASQASMGYVKATSSSCCATPGDVFIIVSSNWYDGTSGTLTVTLQDP